MSLITGKCIMESFSSLSPNIHFTNNKRLLQKMDSDYQRM